MPNPPKEPVRVLQDRVPKRYFTIMPFEPMAD